MMTAIVNFFEAAGLTVSDKKTEAMLLRTPNQTTLSSLLVTEAAGQRHKQTAVVAVLYQGGAIDETADITAEITRRVRLAWACFDRFMLNPYNTETASSMFQVHMQKSDVMATLLYGCVAKSRHGARRCIPQRKPQARPPDHCFRLPTWHRLPYEHPMTF